MAGDDPVAALYIGRHLGVSQQLKFRGALSVKPHAHKIVEYGHGTSRQNTNEFYAKNGQIAGLADISPHVSTQPKAHRIGFKIKEHEAEEDWGNKSWRRR